MATPAQAMNDALSLVAQAADLLNAAGEHVPAAGIRHTLAGLQRDERVDPVGDDMRVPLSLMQMAMALIDQNGNGATATACALQAAIDYARDAKAMRPGDRLDPRLEASILGRSPLRHCP